MSYEIYGTDASWDGDYLTTWPNFPSKYPVLGTWANTFMGAGKRRVYNNAFVPASSLIPGVDSIFTLGSKLGHDTAANIVLPFTPIHIPEYANSVTITVSWNLDGFISQYDNNTPGNPNDDIFIVKNGFWETLNVFIDYN